MTTRQVRLPQRVSTSRSTPFNPLANISSNIIDFIAKDALGIQVTVFVSPRYLLGLDSGEKTDRSPADLEHLHLTLSQHRCPYDG